MLTALISLVLIRCKDATPEATVQGMFDAFNNKDWKGVFSRFEGAKVDSAVALVTLLTGKHPEAPMPKFTVKIDSMTPDGDGANGKLTINIQVPGSTAPVPSQGDEVQLHRVNGDWKIVTGSKSGASFITELAKMARDPKSTLGARGDASRESFILSDFKQVALGVLMYANDWDDKLSFTQATMKAKLYPYLKNNQVWQDPEHKPLDIEINPALVGKLTTNVKDPAKCVMLSLGSRGNLIFIGDRTPIAYLDGHCAYLTRPSAVALSWK